MTAAIYVAGPYTNGDVAANVRNAMWAADKLLDYGFFPYVPHLTHFQHMSRPRQYEEWMKLDLYWLEKCHGVLRLPGESAGADRECERAQALGIPVFTSMTKLVEAFA